MKRQIAKVIGDIHLLLPTTQIEACASLSSSRAHHPVGSSMHSSCQDLTTATQSWQVLPSQQPSLYNAYKMQQRISYLGSEHVTLALRQLHWLPVHQRIQHKLCTMMHSVHHGMCPVYLADTVSTIADNLTQPPPTARRICYQDVICPWASVHSFSLAHSLGTLCFQLSMT